jgi:hypothetical protein
MRIFWITMLAGLLFCPEASLARGGKDARIFRSFVREVKVGSRFFATGPKGKQNLEGCIFTQKIHFRSCKTIFSVDTSTLKYARKNSKSFVISGDPLSGFSLQASQRRLDEIRKVSPKSSYIAIMEQRAKVLKLIRDMGTHKAPGEDAHLQEKQPEVDTQKLLQEQQKYVKLLEAQLSKERDLSIEEWIQKEIKIYQGI